MRFRSSCPPHQESADGCGHPPLATDHFPTSLGWTRNSNTMTFHPRSHGHEPGRYPRAPLQSPLSAPSRSASAPCPVPQDTFTTALDTPYYRRVVESSVQSPAMADGGMCDDVEANAVKQAEGSCCPRSGFRTDGQPDNSMHQVRKGLRLMSPIRLYAAHSRVPGEWWRAGTDSLRRFHSLN